MANKAVKPYDTLGPIRTLWRYQKSGYVPPSEFSFEFSGSLDSSNFQTDPLDFPFAQLSLPLTAEIEYTLDPLDYRTSDGGFGGFGMSLSSQEKNFGFEIQCSNPTNFFISTYEDYAPIEGDPENASVLRHDWSGTWPEGTPPVRVTLDANLVPHAYFDGVEIPLIDGGPAYEYTVAVGQYANAYGYAGQPGMSVDMDLKIVSGIVVPPSPL